MKYKVGDKVKVRSRAWWDNQPKDEQGHIQIGYVFTKEMSSLCGRIVTIESVDDDSYSVEETSDTWEDWMFEPAYTYLDIDLPEWWDGRPIYGEAWEGRPIYGEAWDCRGEDKEKVYCCGIIQHSKDIYTYVCLTDKTRVITESFRHFKPLPKQQTSAKVVITKDGESREVELTDEQIKKLGI